MAIQKISDIDKGSIQAVEGIAKTSIEAMDGITASFVTYDSIVKSVAWGDFPSHPLSGTFYGGYRPCVAYDTTEDLVIVGWQEVQSPHEPRIIIGALDPDGSVSWGSPISINGTNKGLIFDMAFNPSLDSGNGALMVLFSQEDGSGDQIPYGCVVTVNSDKTASVGSASSLSGQEITYGSLAYDEDTASMYAHYKHGTVCRLRQFSDAADDLNFFDSSKRPFSTTNTQTWPHLVYAKSINRMLAVVNDNGVGRVNCGTMDSNDADDQEPDWGDNTGVAFTNDSNVDNISVAWDENLDKGIIVYQGDSEYGNWATFTVNTSTNAVTVNSSGTSEGTFQSSVVHPKVIWNQNEGHFVVVYRDAGDSYKMKIRRVALSASDTSTSWGTARTAANYTVNFHTHQNIYKAVYIPDGSKGIFFPVVRDHYSDIDCYRISAQGTDYNNSV